MVKVEFFKKGRKDATQLIGRSLARTLDPPQVRLALRSFCSPQPRAYSVPK